MHTYACDFETYYDKECSIKTLGTQGYFNHPNFDAYMVSVWGSDGTRFVGDPREFDWSLFEGNRVLSHNASFDEAVYFFGVSKGWWPSVNYHEWLCTADMTAFLGMPRNLKGAAKETFGVELSKDVRDNMCGKKWNQMTEEFRQDVKAYALSDAEFCYNLWETLGEKWPDREKKISMINRRVAQRGIPIDWDALQKNLGVINTALFEAEQSIPWIQESTPLSRKAFNAQCRKQGIEPPKSLAKDSPEAEKWFDRHGQECAWAMAVSDYRRINSFKKKLEAFANGTTSDGRYYGGFLYFGASTGRFSGSGGNLNLQNLPRGEMFGVDFRKMIKTPEGRSLVVVDLSQIEVRTLAYLAGDRKALDLIAESEDIYHAFGVLLGLHDPANGQLKEYDSSLRHKIKSIVLGCFEADTLVLTDSGWKPILYVTNADRVWDGVEWVTHGGVVCQGTKETIRAAGIGATPDHLFLGSQGWSEWQELVTDPYLMKSASEFVNLPSSIGLTTTEHGTQKCDATVDGSDLSTDTTSHQVRLRDVTLAPNSDLHQQTEESFSMKTSCLKMKLDSDYLTAYPLASTDAITKMTGHSTITEEEALRFIGSGAETVRNSLLTLLPLKDGTTQSFSSTESTMTEGTNPLTYGSYQDPTTCETDEKYPISNVESLSSKRKCLVFDVLLAGPRNRFTILTNHGPMLVHNCGYGMGPDRFAEFSNMELAEAANAVNLYRRRLPKVVQLWNSYDEGIRFSVAAEDEFAVELVSGRVLRYGRLRQMRDSRTGKFRYVGKIMRQGRRMDVGLWGGIITENASQGLARDIFSDMMVRVSEAGYDVVMHVHDELVVEVDSDKAELALADIVKIMSTPPEWIPDIPLAAEGKVMNEYSK
jgi:DNA polymerase I-like protein with 3'-5' exonuclease and polymerase domains